MTMTAIVDRYERFIREECDSHGQIKAELHCHSCGVKLGGRIPAETYAGTYNGLCYSCSGAPEFVTHQEALDGAWWWSYPPHCPSWRRDRESFVAYSGCETCGGRGVVGGHSWNRGYERCTTCGDRYYRHPKRKALAWQSSAIHRAANARFERRLRDATGLPARASKKRVTEAIKALPEDQVQTIREAALEEWGSASRRLKALRAHWGMDERRDIAPAGVGSVATVLPSRTHLVLGTVRAQVQEGPTAFVVQNRSGDGPDGKWTLITTDEIIERIQAGVAALGLPLEGHRITVGNTAPLREDHVATAVVAIARAFLRLGDGALAVVGDVVDGSVIAGPRSNELQRSCIYGFSPRQTGEVFGPCELFSDRNHHVLTLAQLAELALR